jgi:hypothetical protein
MWNTPAIALLTVTSQEESRALTNLNDLLSRDLSQVEPDQLAQGVKDAETTGDCYTEWSGRLIAALYHQGRSWSQIAEMTGVRQTTAYRRAQPYL